MKGVDIANEIFVEFGEPTSLSIPAIAFWLRNNIGALNTWIDTTYALNDSYEIVDASAVEISEEAKAILKKAYVVYFYENKMNSILNSLTTDSAIEIKDGGVSIKKADASKTSRSIGFLKKEIVAEFNDMVAAYKSKGTKPIQVAGDDTVEGIGTKGVTTRINESSRY